MSAAPLRVLSIFGTRPEAVKMAPIIARLQQTAGIASSVCVTAQHRQMLDQVLALFAIEPDHDLDLMRPEQSPAEVAAGVFRDLGPILEAAQPDWVLVQGDTTTVMAAAILAYYHQIRVGHVEAGLRTGDKWQPFPEELNRRLASVVADLHFAPTARSEQNLLDEGVPAERIRVTGNPVIDALQEIASRPYDPHNGPLSALQPGRRMVMITAHRRENFGAPLERIFGALRTLAERYHDAIQLVYPVHLNPNVYGPAHRILGGLKNVLLIDPVDYLTFVHLMKEAEFILTDSGGIQEEAPALGIPVLVLRELTERPEALEAGTARLVGSDPDTILREAERLLNDAAAHAAMASAINPFGDGHAAERIVAALLDTPSPVV